MATPQAWMPSGLDDSEKDAIAARFPNDPHMAAAVAWEEWSATLPPEEQVTSVSTGAQSISYAKSAQDAGFARAAWHRARCRAYSVEVGGSYRRGWDYTLDDFDGGVIPTFDSPSIPPTGAAQINLVTGVVGPSDQENHA